MANSRKVVWSEGMFMHPQHFQQQDRYFERVLENRCGAYSPYFYGYEELSIDTELLKLGKISLLRAKGIN
jgi:type VI secretion system protein ImpJ